jgi:hypothetical protein
MRTASWVLLTFVSAATLLISLLSANLGYRGGYQIAGLEVTDVAGGRPEVLTGLRGVRGTSAAYGAAYAVLFLSIVLGPYRRGDVWAWWTLFAAILTLLGVVLLRLPFLGTTLGVGATAIPVGLAFLGLLLDAKRLAAPRPA